MEKKLLELITKEKHMIEKLLEVDNAQMFLNCIAKHIINAYN